LLALAPRATKVRTATLSLVHSKTEDCAPGCYRSPYTRLTDPAINDALQTVTGYLRPTTAYNLPILAGIQPAKRRPNGAILPLTRRAMDVGHLLH